MNIPNLITVLRVLLIPIFILLFYLPYEWSYMASTVRCSPLRPPPIGSTATWPGAWNRARRSARSSTRWPTNLMVAVALVLLVQEHGNLWLTLPAAVIIGREIVVSALREWMAEIGARAHVAVSNMGKWKTAAQMLALVILLANPSDFSFWVLLGYALLLIAAGLTLWSMLQYLRAAWPHLRTTVEKKIKLF